MEYSVDFHCVVQNTSGQIKIYDFVVPSSLGNAIALSRPVGTIRYMSPEQLLGFEYGCADDIWSVGIMLIELWNQQYPFSTSSSSPIELISELEDLDFNHLLRRFSPLMREFAEEMLSKNPSERADCSQLISHRWFQYFHLTDLSSAHQVGKSV